MGKALLHEIITLFIIGLGCYFGNKIGMPNLGFVAGTVFIIWWIFSGIVKMNRKCDEKEEDI